MSKHTPAPWVADMGYAGGFEVCAQEPESGATLVLCSRGPWTHRTEMSAANARLIAAAPELLEALQKFVAWSEAENNHKGTTFWERVEMMREVDALAAAAIAKATGEQQ